MTFEEAKKILEKEFAVINLHKSTEPFEFDDSNWFEYEKPSVLEAFRVLSKEGYYITISGHDYDMRKKRLEKEYEKNTKAPGPGEEQSKEGNPALAESASQFNDALLDEQAKKIAELTKDKELMKKATLSQLDDFIEIYNLLTKESQKTKRLGKEIAKLNGIIHDKNAILSDVAEELRLSKIREKNLTEVCQKYVKEVEDLRKQLANNVVDKIDAQALKSAESALAWKEKVIAEKDMALAYNEKEIADLQEKLKSIYKNRHIERVYKKKLVEKEKVIEKLQKQLKYKSPLPSGSVEAIDIYVNNISRARRGGFNKSVASTIGETELSETYEYGDKKLKYALHFNEDGSITYECSDPDKKKRHDGDGLPTPEEPKYDNSFEGFVKKLLIIITEELLNLVALEARMATAFSTRWLGLIMQRKAVTILV